MNLKKSSLTKKQKIIDEDRKKICTMNYEESIKELDKILQDLQMENVPIEKLQSYYTKGNLLVEHCTELLKELEQDVIEINSDNIKNLDVI